jgi:ABC-2 type transport system ATP-binding protein
MDTIQIHDVTKIYGEVKAVDQLSLTVPEGSIYGFIGPNGSGKTTTLRMIVGILHPDSGSISVFGKSMSTARSGLIGYLPEERGIYVKMTVRALLEFHGRLRGGNQANHIEAKVESWLKKFDLDQRASRRVETLSKGMVQKVQFIAAVIPEPRLLILDEPFSGLDPVSAQSIREAILELRRSGCTILLSTHDMSVAETMCDRIFMIFRGKKVLDGTLKSIQEQYGNDTLRIKTENGPISVDGIPGLEMHRDLGQIQELRLVRGGDSQYILRTLISRARIVDFSVTKPSLEDIFIRIAGPAAVSTNTVANTVMEEEEHQAHAIESQHA